MDTATTFAAEHSDPGCFLDRSDERDTFLARILDAERRGYERGYLAGYRDGYNSGFPGPLIPHHWTEPHFNMEERRYGPLPDWFTEPEEEEHPGEARRRARALASCRPGGFSSGEGQAAA